MSQPSAAAGADPRFLIRLKGGGRVDAIEVDLAPGWVNALVIVARPVVDEDTRTARVEVTGLERRSYPVRRILEVVELQPEPSA